jgi:methyltransferase
MIGWAQAVALIVAAQRLLELWHANRNTRALLAQGGTEHGRKHYILFPLLHTAWLLSIFALVPADREPIWPLLALYILLQPIRLWIIISLGARWTTRVITVPDAVLSEAGPYRYFKHPNYLLVALEIALLPLAFGAWDIALVFSLLNAALLWHRTRVEDTALGR